MRLRQVLLICCLTGLVCWLSDIVSNGLIGSTIQSYFHYAVVSVYLIFGVFYALGVLFAFYLAGLFFRLFRIRFDQERVTGIALFFGLIYFHIMIIMNKWIIYNLTLTPLTIFMNIFVVSVFLAGLFLYNLSSRRYPRNLLLIVLGVSLILGHYAVTRIFESFFINPNIRASVVFLETSELLLAFFAVLFAVHFITMAAVKFSEKKKLGIVAVIALTVFVVSIIVINISGRRLKSGTENSGPPNIILIVMDTARAENFSCYGYERNTSPNLEAFCKEGFIFRTYSSSSWTLPGHASIFTGKFLRTHGARVLDSSTGVVAPLNDDEVTLAEMLKDHGYRTAGISSNHAQVNEANGFDQGFDDWYSKPDGIFRSFLLNIVRKMTDNDSFARLLNGYLNAGKINRLVFRWLDQRDREPFFLFINYMDTHDPYVPPPPYNGLFDGRMKNYPWRSHTMYTPQLGSDHIRHLFSQYDGAIAYLDSELKKLFEKLKELDEYDNSVIIVTSDHGEYLGEHGKVSHSQWLNEEVISIPMIIKLNRDFVFDGKLSGDPVSVIDILPTVLDILDIPVPEQVNGTSLFAGGPVRPVLSEYYGSDYGYVVSKIEDSLKIIVSTEDHNQLFDLSADPGELNNLIKAKPALFDSLFAGIMDWREAYPQKPIDSKMIAPLSQDAIRRLKSLGYIK